MAEMLYSSFARALRNVTARLPQILQVLFALADAYRKAVSLSDSAANNSCNGVWFMVPPFQITNNTFWLPLSSLAIHIR